MSKSFHPVDPERFEIAMRRFDEENARDPNRDEASGRPRELVYAEWLTGWLQLLAPDASEELRLAARCQHICRWEIPRESYPLTRAGYLQWRAELKKLHARKAGEILAQTGYPEETIRRVQFLNLKQGLPNDRETQMLEDALCLVFLEKQFGALAGKTAEDKVINAVKKTWSKMSPAGRDLARQIQFTATERALLQKALAAPEASQSLRNSDARS